MGQSRNERIKSAYNDLNKDNLQVVDDFYDEKVVFEDPLSRWEGRPLLKNYYAKLYEKVSSIRFDIHEIIESGETSALFWKMTMTASGLNGGKPMELEGSSLLRFSPTSNKVIYHRDYFDMGQFVYERIPVLKNLIGFIKNKMAHP